MSLTRSGTKAFAASLGLVFFSLGISLALLEMICRGYFIPKAVKAPYVITENQTPFFALQHSYKGQGITIQSGRRELEPRKGRNRRISFVGDSVTFCTGLADAQCFTEILQKRQSSFDIYNHGVVGYGAHEIAATAKRVLSEQKPELLIYVYNFNDVHEAMPYPLELVSSSKQRLASVGNFLGPKGEIKVWLKDHFRTLFVAQHLFATRNLPDGDNTGPTARQPSSEAPRDCRAQLEERVISGGEGFYFSKIYPAWQKMYRDSRLTHGLVQVFQDIKNRADQAGARFLIVPFYDYVFFSKGDASLARTLGEISNTAGVSFLDTYAFFSNHAFQCGFYNDVAHFGALGSQRFADFIEREVIAAAKARVASGSPAPAPAPSAKPPVW